jgi:protein subunit release factor B
MSIRKRELLFSVKKSDLVFEYFRCGGKGGQKQNKTSSGARCKHPPSGSVGESREERSQSQNKKIAFRRMTETREFKTWIKLKCSEIYGIKDQIDRDVKIAMHNRNLKIERYNSEKKAWENERESERT